MKNDCKMYSPHKKCYESYEILMGSVIWVVMGRFKRKGKKQEDQVPYWQAKKYTEIKGEKGECWGWGWDCHNQGMC